MTTGSDPRPRPRRGRGRPRGGGGAQTKERILAAAAGLFAESGYRGATMMAVAEAAGLSQTGLLHHFPDKERLLAEVLDRRDRLDEMAIGERPGRGWERFEYLRRLVEHNTTQPGIVRLFTALAGEAIDPEHPAHEWLLRHHRRAAALIRGGLDEAVAAGTADPETPVDRIVRETIALMDGLQLQWLVDPGGVDMAGDFADHVANLRTRWER
ncbi:TetR/AcrR family transcriptional regulator [Saccharopolyspora griseoalba]|uniref:TetR/AcrR family transcriptional regulator n=1 Tax=Saccharopolyspora griseoalba TaxID=1431848 RepID=A0ABW2LT27_9PSEU